MPRPLLLERKGWPPEMVEYLECAGCGNGNYSKVPAPMPRGSVAFDRWVESVFPWGRSMQTRVGFAVWCSSKCESTWKRANAHRISVGFSPDHGHNVYRREIESRARKTGEYAR
jgi:hypothetical protein